MLEGRIALVTGASSGIGLAVARAVVAGGGKVALVARTEANLRHAARELGTERAAVFPLDVTDLARLSPRVLTAFFVASSRRLGAHSMQGRRGCVRSFLRYLHREGVTTQDLSPTVERGRYRGKA